MKKSILIALTAIFILSGMLANAQQRQEKMHKINPAQRKEMKTYIQENIIPVAKIQRQELDKQISNADKTRIEELRAELKSNQSLMREKREAMHATQEKPTVEQRKAMREMRNEIHELMNEAGILTEKYYQEIEDAMAPIRENMETWQQEMMKIRKQYAKVERPRPEGRQGDRPPKHERPGHQGKFLGRIFSPERFLLWDSNNTAPFFQDESADKIRVNLFPNPASNSVQVSVELDDPGNAEIVILNSDGNEVANSGKMDTPEGLTNKSFDISNLDNGIYFVKVTAGGYQTVERLIIQK